MKDKKTKQIDDIREDPFEVYIKLGEPDKAEKAYAWQTAVGLQAVDEIERTCKELQKRILMETSVSMKLEKGLTAIMKSQAIMFRKGRKRRIRFR